MRDLLLLGGGGHCASCIEAVESTGAWEIRGIVDAAERVGQSVLGYPVVGTDEELPALVARFGALLVTVGQARDARVRERLFELGRRAAAAFATVVASSAFVSARAQVREGTIVMHRAFVNARASVGLNCIVNTGAIIEHDASVGDHTHVSTGAVVNGGCSVGRGCLIGSGAVLLQGVRVADGAIVGAGAVVVRSIEEPGVYAGCPARKMG
jgi:sugar O-acyltransferase (sialic acid O-acetyltransferase NeuD family)